MAINMNTLPTEKPGNFSVIPKGSYIAKIVKAEMKKPKDETGTKPMYFTAEADITDPASNASLGKFWINLYESNAPLCLFQISRFVKALNLPITGEFELRDLTKMVIGKSLVVDICPDKEGKKSVIDIDADIFYPIEPQTPEQILGGYAMPQTPNYDAVNTISQY